MHKAQCYDPLAQRSFGLVHYKKFNFITDIRRDHYFSGRKSRNPSQIQSKDLFLNAL